MASRPVNWNRWFERLLGKKRKKESRKRLRTAFRTGYSASRPMTFSRKNSPLKQRQGLSRFGNILPRRLVGNATLSRQAAMSLHPKCFRPTFLNSGFVTPASTMQPIAQLTACSATKKRWNLAKRAMLSLLAIKTASSATVRAILRPQARTHFLHPSLRLREPEAIARNAIPIMARN